MNVIPGTYSEQVQKAFEKALQNYMDRPYVTGIDVGSKYSEGKRKPQVAIRFHVKEKKPDANLDEGEGFPKTIDGVPTDVIEANFIRQCQSRMSRCDPLRPGVSAANAAATLGTLGAFVFDRQSGQLCILSNWHTLVGSAEIVPGDPVVQPSPLDGGRHPDHTVATLLRSILSHDGDAAVAALSGNGPIDQRQFATDTAIRTARMPVAGEILEKSSRTTGVTQGRVDTFGFGRWKIPYSTGDASIDGFKIVPINDGNPDNIEISRTGDSGAVWYDPLTYEAVGLHFAGEANPSPSEECALACYMTRVLTALDVEIRPTA